MSRALAALFALLLLTGCAADGTDASASPEPTNTSAAEATDTPEPSGERITGSGYTYDVPEGWGIPEQMVPGFDPDSTASDLTDSDNFLDNLNVILSPAGAVTPNQIETAGVAELKNAGAKDVTVADRVSVGGSESAHLSATMSVNDTEYVIHQFYASNDEQTYVITFSFSPSTSPTERADVFEPTLASWTWTD